MNIWEILGINETYDRNVIRKAYAEREKDCNPEEHPEEFLKLWQAYEGAIAFVRNTNTPGNSFTQTQEPDKATEPDQEQEEPSVEGRKPEQATEPDQEQEEPSVEGRKPEQATEPGQVQDQSSVEGQEPDQSDVLRKQSAASGFRLDFVKENSFQYAEGIRRFRELYTGKRRKDRAAWADYFVSDVFLEGYREKDFVSLMLEVVREEGEQNPPGKEFLTELYIAYGLCAYKVFWEDGSSGMEFRVDETAPFSGMEEVMEIARMGSAITRLKGNEPALAAGFRDYRELLALEQKGDWSSENIIALRKIVYRYGLANISDKPMWNADQYELSQRHPKSVKLITYFFAHERGAGQDELPVEAYQMIWGYLGLETATQGREKLLYGGLREAVLVHVPGILEQPKVDYKKLTREFFYDYYGEQVTHYSNEGRTPKEKEALDKFFEREDVQIALRDDVFIDKQIARYWIGESSGEYLLEKLEKFYSIHRELSLARNVLEKAKVARDKKRITREFLEDKNDSAEGRFELKHRACLRYYLHTAFHQACGVVNRIVLKEYLRERMPYSEDWSLRFTGEDEGLSTRPSMEIRFGNTGQDVLSVSFHPRHWEYLWNGSPLVPRFPGQALAEVGEDMYFWMLVPVSSAHIADYTDIYEELKRRLSVLELQEQDIPVIADCIAGSICYEEEHMVPMCTLYAEKKEQLFGCDIFDNGTLVVYEEEEQCRRVLSRESNIPDPETAMKLARRQLRQLVMEWNVDVCPEVLPQRILILYTYGGSKVLEGVEEETMLGFLRMYLRSFFEGKVRRLELDFGQRALIFLKDSDMERYACFYFEHEKHRWFRLVGLPEVYEVVDEKDVVYEPFGLGMLPNYLVHRNLGYMKSLLEDIFDQVACEEPASKNLMWSPQVYFKAESQQYHLAQRKFGKYPPEQACNRIQERFYIPVIPTQVKYREQKGNPWEKMDMSQGKESLQAILGRYMGGKLERLILHWELIVKTLNGSTEKLNHYIVLRQDQGCHQMMYGEGDSNGVSFLVANVEEYLRVEKKKYRKVVFDNQTVPGYLVHTDLRRIRDYLDLLFSEIENPDMILRQFGEFAYQNEKDIASLLE